MCAAVENADDVVDLRVEVESHAGGLSPYPRRSTSTILYWSASSRWSGNVSSLESETGGVDHRIEFLIDVKRLGGV
jgi:hypothetical protein